MLLSPPSPPTAHHFSPQPSSSQTTVSRSPLSIITVPSNSYSIQDLSYSPTSASHSEPSPNSKTSTFFGSPFATPPQTSNSSHSVTHLPKTAAFFSSPFADYPTPPPNQQTTHEERPSSSRSLTADFFAAGAFSSCPTSPPSLRSSTSNASLRTSVSHTSSPPDHHVTLPAEQGQDAESTPVPKSHVPLLSRLFPSRYSSSVRRTDNKHPPRGFITIDPPDILVSSPSAIEGPHISGPHPHIHISDAPVAAVAVPPPSADTPGALVHPDNEEELSYELLRRIGQGAFSHVWLARVAKRESEGMLVAVKMIARGGEHDDPVARRAARGERASFLREVEVLHVGAPPPARLLTLTLRSVPDSRTRVTATIICIIYGPYTSRARP